MKQQDALGFILADVPATDWREGLASIIFMCVFLLTVIAFFIWWLRR